MTTTNPISFFEFHGEETMRQLVPSVLEQSVNLLNSIIQKYSNKTVLQSRSSSQSRSHSSTENPFGVKTEHISLALYALLEAYSLKYCHDNFSEQFYNLKRIQPTGGSPIELGSDNANTLTIREIPGRLSRSFLIQWGFILLPVLLGRSDKIPAPLKNSTVICWEALNFISKFAFLFQLTDYYSFGHRLLGLHFDREVSPLTASGAIIWHKRLFRWLTLALPMGLFLRKLWQWWLSTGSVKYKQLKKQQRNQQEPSVSPPPPLFPARNQENVIAQAGKCPLCQTMEWKEPMVSKTGFIYCKNCIMKSLQVESICQMTRLTLTTSDMRPLYL